MAERAPKSFNFNEWQYKCRSQEISAGCGKLCVLGCMSVCVCLCKCEDTCYFSSLASTDISLAPGQTTLALTNRFRRAISCNIYPVTRDYFHANGSEKKDFPRATYDLTRQLEYFMSEYCNDLCELWELLEEMPAELEVYPFWSCNTENEWFSLCKETVGAGFGFKAWWRNMDGPAEQHTTARSSPCGLDFSFGWPSDTSPVLKSVNLYNNSESFPRFENWKRFRKAFPSAPYNSQGLKSELSK